jgi:hypothetical protein
MSPIKRDIVQELIRIVVRERTSQARRTSTLALISAASVSLLGFVLLLLGRVPEGSIVTTSGLANSIHCFRLAKDANDRLDKTFAHLKDYIH